MIVPIIIYVEKEKKSPKEIEREREIKEMMRRDSEMVEQRKRAFEREQKEILRLKRQAKEEALEKEYREGLESAWLDWQILPEGWNIFGQTNFQIIKEL